MCFASPILFLYIDLSWDTLHRHGIPHQLQEMLDQCVSGLGKQLHMDLGVLRLLARNIPNPFCGDSHISKLCCWEIAGCFEERSAPANFLKLMVEMQPDARVTRTANAIATYAPLAIPYSFRTVHPQLEKWRTVILYEYIPFVLCAFADTLSRFQTLAVSISRLNDVSTLSKISGKAFPSNLLRFTLTSVVYQAVSASNTNTLVKLFWNKFVIFWHLHDFIFGTKDWCM